VLFYRDGLGDPSPRNEMRGVDFSGAKLRVVEFRGLDLDDVRFPSDPDLNVIESYYVATLDRVLRQTKDKSDKISQVIEAGF
jgi:hypothetical protein